MKGTQRLLLRQSMRSRITSVERASIAYQDPRPKKTHFPRRSVSPQDRPQNPLPPDPTRPPDTGTELVDSKPMGRCLNLNTFRADTKGKFISNQNGIKAARPESRRRTPSTRDGMHPASLSSSTATVASSSFMDSGSFLRTSFCPSTGSRAAGAGGSVSTFSTHNSQRRATMNDAQYFKLYNKAQER